MVEFESMPWRVLEIEVDSLQLASDTLSDSIIYGNWQRRLLMRKKCLHTK